MNDIQTLPAAPTWRQRLTAVLGGLSGGWAKAGPAAGAGLRGLAPLLALAAVVTALVLTLLWRDQAGYKPVFGQRERVATADVLAVLDAEHIAYRLHPDSGQVLVPESELGRARMLLAAKGVVAKLPAGLELMDRSDPLGVSQFVQDIRFRRGLEGELAQSMMALDAVESARVHLSIAKSSSFVLNDGQKSAASVMVTLKAGRTLSHEQIAAAINLIAGSVANLEPSRVSLVDQAGHLLSARVDLSEGFEGGTQGDEAQRRVQDEVRRNVHELLAPVLGDQNYRLSVTAEVNNDRVQETREQFGDAPKLTNEAMREEQERERIALGVPGSLSNRPPAAMAAAAASAAQVGPDDTAGNNNSNTARKNASTRQYAYDRSITQVKKSRGRLERLSVAVLLNTAAAPGGATTWSTDDIAKVERLLSGGLGLDTTRGDKLSVSTLAFPVAPIAEPWYQQRDTLVEFGGWAAYALAALLGYLLIARPLLRMGQHALGMERRSGDRATAGRGDAGNERRGQGPELTPLEPIGGAAAGHVAAGASLDGASARPTLAGPAAGSAVSTLLENFELPPPGSPVDVLVDHLKVLAAKEPERVAEVVKQWVQKKNGRSE
ncbi:flagellar basal-body MS-ring/collar protein FliF [Roseateles amylovorans]|uniref:Flagellar M-ring protein n=1 Tax=Roseateles amylovorans TaxID=2978473 RepID=A0ABY6AX70_9BURK|nr:flagellar basal-body MS-ring/collar protein FliF [Roseateles amylovorans]UXH76903.1 flagellar basal-body MS-ring/collar protein FliF [Roseateles amylovorans]